MNVQSVLLAFTLYFTLWLVYIVLIFGFETFFYFYFYCCFSKKIKKKEFAGWDILDIYMLLYFFYGCFGSITFFGVKNDKMLKKILKNLHTHTQSNFF